MKARSSEHRREWRREVEALDVAVYAAISATPTPTLDRHLAAVSRAADHAKLWSGVAAVLALAGRERGRRPAVDGLASLALTSTVVNVGLKPLGRRRRPDRAAYEVPITRRDPGDGRLAGRRADGPRERGRSAGHRVAPVGSGGASAARKHGRGAHAPRHQPGDGRPARVRLGP
jgi:hypothetical protein